MIASNYLQSREIFRELASGHGAAQQVFHHDATAPDEPELTTDVALLGPADASALIVIASGTHGVEAYGGAACQFHFLQSWPRFAHPGIAWLLVHAVNPWGYHHDRRVTPEGVDLNRNFVEFSQLPVPRTAPSAYRAYHRVLVEDYRPFPRGLCNELRLVAAGLTAQRRKSLQAAITEGQYDMPHGLFFGGPAATRSRLIWERIVTAYTAGRSLAVLLDLHTGLGRPGSGELISYLPSSGPEFRRLNAWFNGKLVSMASGESVSAAVQGTLTAGFDRLAPCDSAAIGLEFGTRAPLVVLNALRADQWYRNHAEQLRSQQREWVRRKMKQAFCLSDTRWEAQVLTRFAEVVGQLRDAVDKRRVT